MKKYSSHSPFQGPNCLIGIEGLRLIDRLWPRGVSKEEGTLDDWMKDIAPSTELREWFGHDPKRWPEFERRYRAQLRQHTQELDRIRALVKTQTVTLVYNLSTAPMTKSMKSIMMQLF